MSFRSVPSRIVGTVAAVGASLAFAGPAAGAAGDLDPTYGSDGLTAVSIDTEAFPVGAVLQSDGKLVLVGTSVLPGGGRFMIVRLTPNGEMDPSFGENGVTVIPLGQGGAALGAVTTPDGGIVVVGFATPDPRGTVRMAAIQLDRFGRQDDSFGDGGVFFGATEGEALAVARAADGSLLLAGLAQPNGIGSLAVQKLTADGEPDTTFGPAGGDGLAQVTFPGGASSGSGIVLLPDGRALVSGSAETPANDHAFALARLTTAGAPDPTFGGGSGTVTTDVGPGFGGDATDVALAADGKIVAAGSSGPTQFAVARWLPDGTPDPSFGSGGTVSTPILLESQARAVFAMPDGSVIAAGRALDDAGTDLFAVARYRPDGSLDPGFGSGGTVVTRFGSSSASGVGGGITPDGQLVVGGSYAADPAKLPVGIAAARYLLINPPSNQAPPTVSGTGAPGQPLTCAPGTWSGADAFDFLWLRDGVPIAGAITSTYVPLTTDIGTTLSCTVTAHNGGGSATATSAGVAVVVPPSTSNTQSTGAASGQTVNGNVPPSVVTSEPSNAFAFARVRVGAHQLRLGFDYPGRGTLDVLVTTRRSGASSARLRPGPRSVTVGKLHDSAESPQTKTLRVPLSHRAQTILARRGKLPIRLSLVFTPEGGQSSRQAREYTVHQLVRQ